MENKTAVEFLFEKINAKQNGESDGTPLDELFNKALEIEKEQITQAYRKGSDNAVNVYIENGNNISAKQYYKYTYEKNNI